MSVVVAPGVKIAATPICLSSAMSSVWHDPAPEDDDVARSALRQQLHDLREKGHVGPGQHREPDGVGVLLKRRLHDLFGVWCSPV